MFNEICSFKNIHSAYLKARKCKRYHYDILDFNYNLERHLLKIKKDLENQTYRHSGYRTFFICDSKKRQIKAPSFVDRVVHHALCNIIDSLFDKCFIFDSYACRKGKGTHCAIRRLEHFLKSMSFQSQGGGLLVQKFFACNATFQNILIP